MYTVSFTIPKGTRIWRMQRAPGGRFEGFVLLEEVVWEGVLIPFDDKLSNSDHLEFYVPEESKEGAEWERWCVYTNDIRKMETHHR